jgi:hypothetical protein
MFKWSYSPLCTILLLLLAASLSAQNPQSKSSTTDKPPNRQVTASASDSSIRFTSLGELIQMRLEVIGSSGDVLFDSDFKPANLIDWPVATKQGQRLPDGSYLCVVTVRDSSGQLTRKHGIASLRDQYLSLKQSDYSLLTAAQAQASAPASGEDVSLTIIEPGESSATAVLAHDGSTAHLVSGSGGLSISSGDFFSGKDTEQMRLTQEGNLGIGTATPQARLDVAGMIRSQGLILPDGSILTSAGSVGGLAGGGSDIKGTIATLGKKKAGKVHSEVFGPISGDGTVNTIAKFTGANTIAVSALSEVGGNVGIGTTSPGGGLHIFGLAGADVFAGMGPDLVNGPALNYGYSGSSFGRGSGFFNVRPDALAVAPNPSLRFMTANVQRMIVTNVGNVGIGIFSPSSLLDVAGNINTSTQYGIGGNRMLSAPGSGNLFAGLNAGISNISGINNSFFGALAGQSNTTQGNNSFFGNHAGKLTTVGANSFFGASAGETNSTGTSNSFFGINAGFNSSSGNSNAFFGASAGNNNSTGSSNAFFGASSGQTNFTGSSLTIVGNTADVNASNLTNATAIGANSFVAQSNSLVLGSISGTNGATASTAVGIGTISPQTTLDVANPAAQIRFGNTSSDNGGYLVSTDSSQAILSGGAKWNGSAFVAKSTAASLVETNSGAVRFYTNSGLTAGSTFTPAQKVVIQSDGNVGIGTTSPANRLHVVASIVDVDGIPDPGEHVALIENTHSGPGQAVLALKLGDPIPLFTDNFITFYDVNDADLGAIEGNNSGGVSFVGPGNDYAEWLPRLNPAEQIQPGEIVGLYGGHITKNTRGAAQVMVLSTGSIVAGNDPGKDARGKYDLVAFIGQVKTRVRGTVQAGDFIVASGLGDGIGVAVSPECITSEQFEQVVGQAWETSADSGLKSVRIAVGLIRRDPTVSRLLEYSRHQAAQIGTLQKQNVEFSSRLAALESKMMSKTAAHKSITSYRRKPSTRPSIY